MSQIFTLPSPPSIYDYPLAMKYLSSGVIIEMKARGIDRATIEKAPEQSKRWVEGQEVCDLIRSAFKGVSLGNGIGLTEAQGLDDHGDSATRAAYREKDEKEEWERITPDELWACNSSLSFFDPEGMRFHLPAYLIAQIRGEFDGLEYRLTRFGGRESDYFILFSGNIYREH
jgi:hypothetical protein